jgi:hypothetical protein
MIINKIVNSLEKNTNNYFGMERGSISTRARDVIPLELNYKMINYRVVSVL